MWIDGDARVVMAVDGSPGRGQVLCHKHGFLWICIYVYLSLREKSADQLLKQSLLRLYENMEAA